MNKLILAYGLKPMNINTETNSKGFDLHGGSESEENNAGS